jgi:hypothetical protein
MGQSVWVIYWTLTSDHEIYGVFSTYERAFEAHEKMVWKDGWTIESFELDKNV